MRDVLETLLEAWRSGQTVGLGTVVRTFKSAPRDPGAAMLVLPDGQAAGSVSGGCVEGAVYELASEAVSGSGPVLERFGISDDDAFAVGLTCGGVLDVFVEPINRTTFPELEQVADDLEAGRPVAVATVIEHVDPSRIGRRLVVWPDRTAGSLGSADADQRVGDDARGLLSQGETATRHYGPEGERLGEGMRVFVSSFAPRPRLIVFGAIDFAAALARLGGFLGYHVTVCDARSLFVTPERFPGVDELVTRWPHDYLAEEIEAGRIDARTAICVLTHDPKFDVPTLQVALRGPELAFLGAMGSRRTHEDRVRRLLDAGLTESEVARVESPIGLALGARTPEETAVSIMAQIIQQHRGGTGERLSASSGAIHGDSDPSEEAVPLVSRGA